MMRTTIGNLGNLLVLWLLGLGLTCGLGADEILISRGDQEMTLVGEILVEAQDGGVLFQSRDGQLWLVQPDELLQKTSGDVPPPLSGEELAEQILSELPEGFEVHQTEHFVICHNTSQHYARWIGNLYERLFRGFQAYWDKKRKWELAEPAGPLPVVVFASRQQYLQYLQRELGQDAGEMVAYYNLLNNRVAMYDMTGLGRADARQIQSFVSQASSYSMVATIVHEGTHQLVFNCGLQNRLADTPLWVNEGLAMYFETPDVNSRTGWRSIGKVNQPRLDQLQRLWAAGRVLRLAELIGTDQVLQDPASSSDAYAHAWALNYYLFRKFPTQYVSYLQKLAEMKPLATAASAAERIELFESEIGKDLGQIEKDFVRFYSRR